MKTDPDRIIGLLFCFGLLVFVFIEYGFLAVLACCLGSQFIVWLLNE